MTISSYAVDGLTCGHCVSAVTDELTGLAGVNEVRVDLTAGGISTVTITSSAPLEEDTVSAALEEAGSYRLAAAG
jgi:copper chaperone CopZ